MQLTLHSARQSFGLLVLLSLVGGVQAQQKNSLDTPPASDSFAPPAWFIDDVARLTQGNGRWVTSNEQYQSDTEKWEYYVMEWRSGPGNASMSGRLSGLANGEASNGDFWLFSQYWDPAKKQAIVQQSGWGGVGIGTLAAPKSPGEFSMEQQFTSFTGESHRSGHRVKWIDDHSYDTWSYTLTENGEEVAGRVYRWIAEPGSQTSVDSPATADEN